MTIHPTLPQELIGEVVDHLGDDSDTLKACSLVSWAWVSRCRAYLFETCALNPDNIAPFRDLLLSTECTFSSHIRRIQASRYSGSPDDHIFDEIAATVRGLKDISELYIQMKLSSVHSDAYPYFRTGFITAFPHATRLDLDFAVKDYWRPRVTVPLLETISFFPALRELHIFELWQDAWDSSTTRVPPPNLHCLELHGNSMDPILIWLNTSNHLRNVDSLTLSSPHNGNVPIVRAAMQQIGCSLRYLEIDLFNPEVDHASVFDLRLHPNLQTLVIHDEGPDVPRSISTPYCCF
ncbi:hypothetical protein MSAN_00813000 [Mycena sanguinolenta]|uniref:F-box domain-containing protein n=1 Tax=Mycena sanguinolenta TaxID=230812 RepID=A0A8H6YZ85_9AGAR|nr:hypothetical protein MSAN_00813000 [Mycena sanguinolenta]